MSSAPITIHATASCTRGKERPGVPLGDVEQPAGQLEDGSGDQWHQEQPFERMPDVRAGGQVNSRRYTARVSPAAAGPPRLPVTTCRPLRQLVQTGRLENRASRRVLVEWLINPFRTQMPKLTPGSAQQGGTALILAAPPAAGSEGPRRAGRPVGEG
jgi:hypothetical protein